MFIAFNFTLDVEGSLNEGRVVDESLLGLPLGNVRGDILHRL